MMTNREQAETTALKALGWLATQPDDIDRFLAISGIDPTTLRSRAGEPEFLAAVMDYLMGDDRLLLGFCEAEGIDPKGIPLARRALPGA